MANEVVPLLLAAGMLGTVAVALLSTKVSNSLVSLFYTAIILGVTFTFYGDALLGLLTMITFAGAISVLLLSVVLITGESKLGLGARRALLSAIPAAALVGTASVLALFPGQAGGQNASDSSIGVINFLWTLRPWDLLILTLVFAGAMVGIISLLGGEE